MNDIDRLSGSLKKAAARFSEIFRVAVAKAKEQPPCMSLMVDEKGRSVDLILDTKRAVISEWIEGEGADICLYRDRETGKIVGCHLPLYHKELVVCRIPKGG